jgi:hypothetical protein
LVFRFCSTQHPFTPFSLEYGSIFNNSGSENFDDDRQSSAAVRAAFDDCHRFVVLRPPAAQPVGRVF